MVRVEVFNLADVSRSFATRTRGKEIASRVLEIAARTESDLVVVDWNGVSAASPSFIDEFVNGIQRATHADSHGNRISFAAEDPGIVSLVDAILRRRGASISFTVQQDKVEYV